MIPLRLTAATGQPPFVTWTLIAINRAVFLIELQVPPADLEVLTLSAARTSAVGRWRRISAHPATARYSTPWLKKSKKCVRYLSSKAQEANVSIRKLEQLEWKQFFDGISKVLGPMQADIQVLSPNIGVQTEARWLPFLGMSYDPKDDIVAVNVEELEHIVWKPQDVYVDDGGVGLSTITVVDKDGVRHMLQLRDPLLLPPA